MITEEVEDQHARHLGTVALVPGLNWLRRVGWCRDPRHWHFWSWRQYPGPRLTVVAGAEGPSVDKRGRVATLMSLMTSSRGTMIQRGKEKIVRVRSFSEHLRDPLLGPGRMLLGILERCESERGKVCKWCAFSQTALACSKVIITAVILKIPMNFPFQPCGGQDGLRSFFAMEYLCVE